MDLQLGTWQMLKLVGKFAYYKIIQYRLSTNETEVVDTNYGQVKGRKHKTLYDDGGEYFAFEGIPFAKPPVGELRFRAPQPPESWEGIRDCTAFSVKPIQKNYIMKNIAGSEDCLYLNVFVKKLKSDKPLPVLVWIYGGAFTVGEATRDMYSPDYFMHQDVVLVTVNYRMSAFGFLSFDDPDIGVPGNAGLKDQVLALRWIKQNISHFNGDASNVTVFGESAGGASTHLLMLSEKTRGLFDKAIIQSGSALCDWVNPPQNAWAYRLALELGYDGSNNDKEVFSFLAKADGSRIADAGVQLLTKTEKRNLVMMAFGPVIEPYESDDGLLTKPYLELMRNTWSNEIPLIIGSTSFEGLLSYPSVKVTPDLLEGIDDCESVLPTAVQKQHQADVTTLKELGLKLKQTYFGDMVPSVKETLMQYLDLISYKYFTHAVHRTVLARLAYASQTPTYLYRFDFDSPDYNHSRLMLCGSSVRGVAHGDDISYLFYNSLGSKLLKSSAEYKTIERMIGMWTAFAATGNPNCKSIEPTVWSAVDSADNIKCLNISEEVSFIELPDKKKLHLWDSLYAKESLL